MVFRGYWLGGGGFTRIICGCHNLLVKPAPTNLEEYFVGAGEPKSLRAIDKLSKPAPNRPINDLN
ncbi:MAG TPA: hypothetical protein DD001_18360 [Microcoleaceae bacterium UBA10368]|nr:hypothetical protein [Microcoleaceae cyanobacterium UBA10368]